MQIAIIIALVATTALVTIALNLGPTATIREKRGLKWLAAIGPMVTMVSVMVALQQLALTRQSGERQDRAYVFVSEIKINLFDGQPVTVDLRPKNYGKTAARDLHVSLSCRIYDWPIKFAPYGGASGDPLSRSILPPGDSSNNSVTCAAPLSAEEQYNLASGKTAVVLLGDIHYRDIFEVPHRSVFRRMVGGPVGFNGNQMSASPLDDEMD